LFFAISHLSWVCFKTRRLDLFLQPPKVTGGSHPMTALWGDATWCH